MSNRLKGILLTVLGVLLITFSLTAVWLGVNDTPDYDLDRSLGATLGLLVMVTGLWLSQKEDRG